MRGTALLSTAYLVAALCAVTLALLAVQTEGEASVPTCFTQSHVASELTNLTDMEFAPDGKLFVLEQAGRVRFVRSDGTLGTFLNITTKVDATGERGLLGIAFDPNFATN